MKIVKANETVKTAQPASEPVKPVKKGKKEGKKNMKYGIYEAKGENCTTYWTFNLKYNEEAEKTGLKKIGETRTKAEASKAVDELYKKLYKKS